MNIHEMAKRHAVQDAERASKSYSKGDLYGALCSLADGIRQPGESIYKARVRASATAEGAALMKAYDMAPKAAVVKKSAPPVSPEAFRKALPGGNILAQVEEAAKQLAREEQISMVKARSEIWLRRPDLKQAYDAASAQARGRPIWVADN